MIVYFHGLESDAGGPKVKYLQDRYGEVYAPKMDYKKNQNLFNDTYEQLKNQKIKLITGSSMGGYFAYYMGKKLGVDTILFNPALPYRSISSNVDTSGSKSSFHNLILGSEDIVILPEDTIKWLEENSKPRYYNIEWGNHSHRTPFNVFTSAFKKYG